jgi:hypothetical protein
MNGVFDKKRILLVFKENLFKNNPESIINEIGGQEYQMDIQFASRSPREFEKKHI